MTYILRFPLHVECIVSHSHQPQEDNRQEPERKYAPRKQGPKQGMKREPERKETKEQLKSVIKLEPKTSRKKESELSVLPVKPVTYKVAAEQIPLSQETSTAALKKRTLLPASVPSQLTGTLGRSMQYIYWPGYIAFRVYLHR